MIALEPTDLVSVFKKNYDAIVRQVELERITSLIEVLKTVAGLKLVEKGSLPSLLPFFKETKYARGHTI